MTPEASPVGGEVDVVLTADERLRVLSNVPLTQGRDDDAIVAAVEAIVRARLEAAEAALGRCRDLVDELEEKCAGGPHRFCVGARLRAALAGSADEDERDD